MNSIDFQNFSKDYHKEEKEILVLFDDSSDAGGKSRQSWISSSYFLAFIDLDSGELKEGKGRINWLVSDEIRQKHTISYPHFFKNGIIYHLKVREPILEDLPKERIDSFYNRFMVTKVIGEGIQNEKLEKVLNEYRDEVIIEDQELGEFVLEKDLDFFEGDVDWLGEEISVYLEVDQEDKETWTKALNYLKQMVSQSKKWDKDFRFFASEKLINLAIEWDQDENSKITREDFQKRMSLSSLSIDDFEGDFVARYDDDDMFYGHCISIYGNIKKGIDDASIEG